jgi:hypothetical protein
MRKPKLNPHGKILVEEPKYVENLTEIISVVSEMKDKSRKKDSQKRTFKKEYTIIPRN